MIDYFDISERHIERLKVILWEYRSIMPSDSERMLENGELRIGELAEYVKLLCYDPARQHIVAYLFSDEIEEQQRKEAYRARIGKMIRMLQLAKAFVKSADERKGIDEQIQQYQAVIDNGS